MLKVATFPDDLLALRQLISEYVAWLNLDLAFQNLDDELQQLASIYQLPNGHYIFALVNGQIAGGVGFKHKTSAIAEIKRLYVRPAFQGQRLGLKLMQAVLQTIQTLGYNQVLLDTVPRCDTAQTLYESMGFKQIPPYYYNPVPNTKFYQLDLNH